MKNPNQKVVVRSNGTLRVQTVNNEKSMTQQQFKDECDINNIMKKYQTTGEFIHRTHKVGQYGDFSEITDYQSMLETVAHAQDVFSSLPAQLRARFQNDPGHLINFLNDTNNYDEALSLGLVNPKQTPNPNPQNEPNDPPKPKTPKTPKSSPEPET